MVKVLVHKSNPWADMDCDRVGCLLCSSPGDNNGDCYRRNVVYKTSCILCHDKGKDNEAFYLGETARTAFERGSEHHSDPEKMKDESHMFNHIVDTHEDEEYPQFSMKVLRGHRTALERQIHEAVIIANSWDKGNLLNSKHEYNRCVIPRISVMMGDQEQLGKKRTKGEEEEDMRLEEELGMKKREKRREGQPRAKRRRRWKIEEKNQGKRSWFAQKEENGDESNFCKRRRIGTSINLITGYTINLGANKVKDTEERKCQLELEIDKGPSVAKTKVQSIVQMFRKIEEKNVESPLGLKRTQSSRDVVNVGTSKQPGTKEMTNSKYQPEKSPKKYISINSSKTPCRKPANKVSAVKFQILSNKVQKSA